MQVMAFHFWIWGFENDVKTYGTQAWNPNPKCQALFENDVKTYGTQAYRTVDYKTSKFENDVKTYGTQAREENNNGEY